MAQQNYESFVLAGNGGQHYLYSLLDFDGSNVNPAGSYFFTADSSIRQSPATAGPQLMTTGRSTLDPAMPLPVQNGSRFLVNGAVFTIASPALQRVSYSGPDVQETAIATDGQTPVQTVLGTDYTVVPLSGAIANSPAELFTSSALGIITDTINGVSLYNRQATWQPGAAYMRVTRHYVGDTVLVDDCAAPATTGTNVTPCNITASTLEAFFPYAGGIDGKTYNLADGQIVSLAGTRVWISNTAFTIPMPEYRVFFERNGQIDSGVVIRDGTTVALQVGLFGSQPFYIFLNSAAVQSVKAAIAF